MPIDPSYLHLVHPGVRWDAYLYGRNSGDPTRKGSSVAAQIEHGTDLCERYGWPVVGIFDGDIARSASRHRRRERQDFETMLEGIRAGECRIVVAFEASRYYRDLGQYLRIRDACVEAGVLLCYGGTVYDLSKKDDRRLTAQDALQAEEEADDIQARNARTARRNAAEGKPHGRIAFGYRREYDPDTGELLRQVEDEVAGPVVRQIFKDVAAGDSIYSIVQRLKETGASAPGRSGWGYENLYVILRNAQYRGRRVHRGVPSGEPRWPALVSDETWAVVQRIISAPERRTSESVTIRHELAGLAGCGVCEGRVGSRPQRTRKGDRYTAYACPSHVSIKSELLEAYVEEGVLAWLSTPAAAAAFEPPRDDEREARRRQLEAMRRQLEEARSKAVTFDADGAPLLSVESLAALEAALAPRIAAGARELEEVRGVPPVVRRLVSARDVEGVWSGLSLSQRRLVYRTVVRVTVNPARARGVKVVEPGRISLLFAGQPGFADLSWRNRPAPEVAPG